MMPTLGIQPSLRSTQAVGAVLLHQFARERFLQAGLDEKLIREAENRERLDDLTTGLLFDDSQHESNSSFSSDLTIIERNNKISSDAILDSGSSSSIVTERDEHYVSTITNQSATEGIDDNVTLYHSVLSNNPNNTTDSINSNKESSLSPLDRIQSSSPTLASYGQELRRIAEEFERTRLRASVKDRAEQVKLSDIKRESFVQLLEELFQEKITREKIVILFFFCTDVAMRAAQLAQELVIKLLGWSFSYIIDRVCQLVYKLGGWDRVLFHQLPSVLISCCAALAIVSLVLYLRKSLRG